MKTEKREFADIPKGKPFKIPGESSVYMRLRNLNIIPLDCLVREDMAVVTIQSENLFEIGDAFNWAIPKDFLLDYILPEESPCDHGASHEELVTERSKSVVNSADLDMADKLGRHFPPDY